jgi:MFS family permease
MTEQKNNHRFNRVIIYLTTSDIFTWGLMIVLSSISGIYLANKLGGDAVKFVGIGTALFSIFKGLLQIPIGIFTDKVRKDKDEITFLLLGNILMGVPFIFYPLINSEYIYYILQSICGIGAAMNLVNWRKLFAKNLDKGKEGLEYGAYDTVMSLSVALFSIIAGFVADLSQHYFDAVIVVIGILMVSSGVWAALIYRVSDRK